MYQYLMLRVVDGRITSIQNTQIPWQISNVPLVGKNVIDAINALGVYGYRFVSKDENEILLQKYVRID